MREPHRRFGSAVENTDAMVLLEGGHDRTHHYAAHVFAGLLDLDQLEATRERRVLLEELLVFAPRGGRERAQFAARQRRLEQVGRVAGTGRTAGPDHGMRFVDEQDDRRRRVLHFLDQPLESILELTLHARAGLQHGEVERTQRHVAQGQRHVAFDDPTREALSHRRLANARLAHENRIVLSATRQDVDHLSHFEIATEHRIDLAGAGVGRHVDGILIEVWRPTTRLRCAAGT